MAPLTWAIFDLSVQFRNFTVNYLTTVHKSTVSPTFGASQHCSIHALQTSISLIQTHFIYSPAQVAKLTSATIMREFMVAVDLKMMCSVLLFDGRQGTRAIKKLRSHTRQGRGVWLGRRS